MECQEEFISHLKMNNFELEELITPVQLWKGKPINLAINDEITIDIVTKYNYFEALNIECSIKEFGGKAVREKAFEQEFSHPQFTYYLLSYKGVACATASLFIQDKQARMESVATLEEYRGKGFIGHLINHIQSEVMRMRLDNLWVIPINEKIEKVYQKYGFVTVEKFKMGHAYKGAQY